MDYLIEKGDYGNRLTLKSAWDDRFYEIIKQNNVVDLYLNTGLGWKQDDLSYLSRLEFILGFTILNLNPFIEGISPVNYLHNLKYLSINTYCKTEINFNDFPQLERCFIEWRAKAKSIFSCTSLKRLSIHCYKGKESAPFANLTNLEHLHLAPSTIKEVECFSALKNLEFLQLSYSRNLSSLKGIENLSNLKGLVIYNCRKIEHLDELSDLHNLEYLYLENIGDIASVKCLRNLKKLERLNFIADVKILDEDLLVLKELPNLKDLFFVHRRHYNARLEEFVLPKVELPRPYPLSML